MIKIIYSILDFFAVLCAFCLILYAICDMIFIYKINITHFFYIAKEGKGGGYGDEEGTLAPWMMPPEDPQYSTLDVLSTQPSSSGTYHQEVLTVLKFLILCQTPFLFFSYFFCLPLINILTN